MTFQPIKQVSISTQIANEIHSSIVRNNLSPGDKLPPAREIARMLGVSNPSVHKAISMLSAAGIVASCTKRGTYVVNSLRNACSDLVLSELSC